MSPPDSPARTRLRTRLAAAFVAGTAVAGLILTVIPPPTDHEPGRRSGALEVGIGFFPTWRDWEVLEESLDKVVDSGARWIRMDVGWCSIEEDGKGTVSQWYLERLDTTLRETRARGLSVLAVVGCTPTWLGANDFQSLPSDPEEFRRITAYLAERYAGQVEAWEIWNEPDCIGGCPNGSPEAYVPILQAGFRGIREGDPSATVVSGGVSGINIEWLRAMYEAGAKGYFDALAVHPYQSPANAGPSSPPRRGPYRMTRAPELLSLMRSYDDEKPVWFTEMGWTTGEDDDEERDGVSERRQAQYLTDSLTMISTEYPFVTHAFWFCLRDRDDSTPYENGFGLLRLDGTERPSFAALERFTAQQEAGVPDPSGRPGP